MNSSLFIYSTCEGQTKKILQHIQQQVVGSQIQLVSLEEANDLDLKQFNTILIGASIRYGKFRPALYQFIEDNSQWLNTIPSAFFGVCLTARKPSKDTPETNLYMQKFNERINWQPKQQAVFAGALLYSRYNWWQTRLIQLIMKMTGGSTDTSADIELTNWDKVDEFGVQFNQLNAG